MRGRARRRHGYDTAKYCEISSQYFEWPAILLRVAGPAPEGRRQDLRILHIARPI